MVLTLKKSIRLLLLLVLGFTAVSCDNEDDASTPSLSILEEHRANLKTVTVGGDNLSYLEYGAGDKTLILLHGLPTSSLLYRKVAQQIAEQTGFRVLAPDLLGFGESDKPDRIEAYSFDSQAQRVFDFATALGVSEFVLTLHDSGGFVGWTMLIHGEANRISGLIITDTTLEIDPNSGFTPPAIVMPIFLQQQTPEQVWGPLSKDDQLAETEIRKFLTDGLFNDALVTDELVEAYSSPVKVSTQTYVGIFSTFPNVVANTPTIKTAFSNFNKPVAIVWGQEDIFLDASIIPNKFKEEFGVPDNRVTVIPQGGHFMQEEKPEEYISAVSTFLNEAF